MSDLSTEYLTTRELAELLRIKERKVYELASTGDIPCSRALGKLLFSRQAVEAWIAHHASGIGSIEAPTRPNVFLGSHDPLLEWAIRESGCGLASYFDGSLDGLERFARGEGIVTGLHLQDRDTEEWNRAAVVARFSRQPVVLVGWTWRERGLIVEPGNPKGLQGIADLKGCRLATRHPEAGSQKLFEQLLAEEDLSPADLDLTPPERTETDPALAILEGKADAAFGLASLARQCRLDFVPVIRERFDLLVWRRAWFEEPLQHFLEFARGKAFLAKAEKLGGYDLSDFRRVHFNGV